MYILIDSEYLVNFVYFVYHRNVARLLKALRKALLLRPQNVPATFPDVTSISTEILLMRWARSQPFSTFLGAARM